MHELPASFLWPAYDRGSIANLPATLGRLLGVSEGWASPGLAIEAEGLQQTDYDRVAVVVLDGLGWNRWSARSGRVADTWEQRLAGLAHGVWPLTSVAPSTTSVATTCLLGNGATPIEHGLLGYTARLPDPGLIANLLFWRPAHGPGGVGSLEDWGVRPEGFLPHPSLFEVLGRGGVSSRVFMPSDIASSPLSRAQMRGVEISGFLNFVDGLELMRRWLGERSERSLGYLYLPDLDGLSHRDGPAGANGEAVLGAILEQLARTLAELAASPGGDRTLVLVTADHGHAATPRDQAVSMDRMPGIAELLAYPPAGEPRHVYLYARAGAAEDLVQACTEAFGAEFAVLAGGRAVAAGLYGPPGRAHPQARARVGDVVMLARGAATFWNGVPAAYPLGMHGSLEPDEMRVPLMAFRV